LFVDGLRIRHRPRPGKERHTAVPDELARILEHWISKNRSHRWVFPGATLEVPWVLTSGRRQTVTPRSELRKACRALGIDPPVTCEQLRGALIAPGAKGKRQQVEVGPAAECRAPSREGEPAAAPERESQADDSMGGNTPEATIASPIAESTAATPDPGTEAAALEPNPWRIANLSRTSRARDLIRFLLEQPHRTATLRSVTGYLYAKGHEPTRHQLKTAMQLIRRTARILYRDPNGPYRLEWSWSRDEVCLVDRK
jgi:hypothetical protein